MAVAEQQTHGSSLRRTAFSPMSMWYDGPGEIHIHWCSNCSGPGFSRWPGRQLLEYHFGQYSEVSNRSRRASTAPKVILNGGACKSLWRSRHCPCCPEASRARPRKESGVISCAMKIPRYCCKPADTSHCFTSCISGEPFPSVSPFDANGCGIQCADRGSG